MKASTILENAKALRLIEREIAKNGGFVLGTQHLPLISSSKAMAEGQLRRFLNSVGRGKSMRRDDSTVQKATLAMREWREITAAKVRSKVAEYFLGTGDTNETRD